MNQPIQALDTPIMLFDGTSVSNPGAAAAAAVLLLTNGKRYTVSQFLTYGTDIEAEYTGLLIGLKKAKQLGLSTLEIKGDNELVFSQVNGLMPVAEANLEPLYSEIQVLMRSFDRVSLECITPEQNRSAVAAVNRCIGEVLGKETKMAQPSQPATPIEPDIAHLIQLGRQATAQDYLRLAERFDDLAFKPLAELRNLVPESERDAIALGWDGDDNHLAEIYRWYCRGLPSEMALRKVEFDNPTVLELGEKLPWEGELSGAPLPEDPIETAEPFPPSSLFDAMDVAPLPIDPPLPILTPVPPPFDEPEPLLSFPFEAPIPEVAAEPAIPELFAIDSFPDPLPFSHRVYQLYEVLDTLSEEERNGIVQKLVQSSEWVNLFLKAIAERMTDGR